MDAREQRGLEIAATMKLRRKGSVWIVPSQAGKGDMYSVNLSGDAPTCSCPDHETRRVKCKHIYAVEFSIRRETRPDGTTTVTKTVRVTYAQDWPACNAAQATKKSMSQNSCAAFVTAFRNPHRAGAVLDSHSPMLSLAL